MPRELVPFLYEFLWGVPSNGTCIVPATDSLGSGGGGCSVYTAPNLVLLLYGLLKTLGVWVHRSEGKAVCVTHCSMAAEVECMRSEIPNLQRFSRSYVSMCEGFYKA